MDERFFASAFVGFQFNLGCDDAAPPTGTAETVLTPFREIVHGVEAAWRMRQRRKWRYAEARRHFPVDRGRPPGFGSAA